MGVLKVYQEGFKCVLKCFVCFNCVLRMSRECVKAILREILGHFGNATMLYPGGFNVFS